MDTVVLGEMSSMECSHECRISAGESTGDFVFYSCPTKTEQTKAAQKPTLNTTQAMDADLGEVSSMERSHECAAGAGEITVVVGGRSGAGKSTLINNLLGYTDEDVDIIPDTNTKDIIMGSIKKNGVTVNIVDTPGLETSCKVKRKQLQRLSREINGHAHLLIYCVPVGPTAKFAESNPNIMKCLQEAYGKEIWKKCVLVFTFSNFAKLKIDKMRGGDPERKYVEYLNSYAARFQEELKENLKVKDVSVRNMFQCDYKGEDISETIVAVPAGFDETDLVLPNTFEEKWTDIIFDVISRKCDSNTQPLLLRYRYGKEACDRSKKGLATGIATGAMMGGAIGGAVGAVVGPFGVPVGMAVGGASGAMVAGIVGGIAGGMGGAASPYINDELEKRKLKKKLSKEQLIL